MKILKFGWTSLWSYEMIKKTSEIVINSKENKSDEIIVVVSAMSKVTNILLEICELGLKWDEKWVISEIEKLREKHVSVIKELWKCKLCKAAVENIDKVIWELQDILKAIVILKQLSNKAKSKILYFWEILSSILLSLFINESKYSSKTYLSKDYIVSYWKYMDWDCDMDKSKVKIKEFIKNVDLEKTIPVFTWFGWWNNDDIYLFDRWWSDYVATLLWSLLDVEAVEIWTDADWVMTADPRKVDFPVIWDELDYEVASEFALSWAKILHPKTLSPIQKKKIPVLIKNTFSPSSSWTKICKISWKKWIKWINVTSNWVILTFIDPSMIWAHGFIYSVLKVLEQENVSIDVMATTETSFSISICDKYYSKDLVKKLENMEQHFKLVIEKDVCKISIVWDSIDTHKVLESIDNVLMISKWAYNKCLTIYTKIDNPDDLLKVLHKDLFEI